MENQSQLRPTRARVQREATIAPLLPNAITEIINKDINDLPLEVLQNIFDNFSLPQRLRIRLVSHKWNRVQVNVRRLKFCLLEVDRDHISEQQTYECFTLHSNKRLKSALQLLKTADDLIFKNIKISPKLLELVIKLRPRRLIIRYSGSTNPYLSRRFCCEQTWTRLMILKLDYCEITGKDLKTFARTMPKLGSLTIISPKTKLTLHNVNVFFPNLEKLCLKACNQITDAQILNFLHTHQRKGGQLKVLHMKQKADGQQSFNIETFFGFTLENISTLRSFRRIVLFFGTKTFQPKPKRVQCITSQLVELEFSCRVLPNEFFRELYLCQMPQLRSLRIDCGTENLTEIELKQMLLNFPSLKDFHLHLIGCSNFNLVDELCTLSNLESLMLGNCNLEAEGVIKLVKSCKDLKYLQIDDEEYLNKTEIFVVIAKKLSTYFKRNSSRSLKVFTRIGFDIDFSDFNAPPNLEFIKGYFFCKCGSLLTNPDDPELLYTFKTRRGQRI